MWKKVTPKSLLCTEVRHICWSYWEICVLYFLNIFRMRIVKKNGTKQCIPWIQKLHSQWQPTWKVCYVRAFQYLKEVPFGKPLLITNWIWRMINLKQIITKNCWPIIIQVEILHQRPNRYNYFDFISSESEILVKFKIWKFCHEFCWCDSSIVLLL